MRDPASAKAWWLGKNPSEIMQAEWLTMIGAIAAQTGVERIFWEGWQDRPGRTHTGIDYFGLLRPDASQKSIVDVFLSAARTRP
jgi:hypothetical protein